MLLPDWKMILRRAWSVRLALLGAVFAAAEFAVSLAPDTIAEFVGRGRFALVAFIVGIGAAVARVVQQLKMTDERSDAKDAE